MRMVVQLWMLVKVICINGKPGPSLCPNSKPSLVELSLTQNVTECFGTNLVCKWNYDIAIEVLNEHLMVSASKKNGSLFHELQFLSHQHSTRKEKHAEESCIQSITCDLAVTTALNEES